MSLEKLNFHLLTSLGLSHDSAEMVTERISELERERDACADVLAKANAWIAEAKPLLEKGGEAERALAARDDALRILFADPVSLRSHILRHGPVGFDLYSAEHIERIKSEARHQVEQKLNDALVKLAAGDCKDSAADNEILRAELRRLLVDECVSRSDADKIAEALRAIEL